ncbi:TraB/GumN family protein [Chitinophaga sp. GCM10012297]|uniref:TraB/GumN family protein n=1 Tax=Chitinophaga chungangae TaxID=2821488 RepID=A0ABS3YL15_9BACT|nr:TraB/GumN family protein [Chitinophaga chungangae]MBO9155382.1 TraB/GumN family protein [Chitinophaga chungangae]
MKYLQRSVLVCLLVAACGKGFAQNSRKYQGLLWEISGNRLAKPSYLFGTMHVSNKLAFNLSDSFYHCIRNVDVVSLETDPQRLQEDFSKSKMLLLSSSYMNTLSRRSLMPRDAFTIGPYGDLVRNGLTYRPEMINHLLYRSFSSQEDFEEDTFLDMYIYQVGSKLGKKATGVENFEESERLMLEAYRDAAKESRNKKNNHSFHDSNPAETRNLLNDAYRRGDLDLLDSLSSKQNNSPAFLEKFLYQRNENMFKAIDSIIRKQSLFAGVGAAHLPGDRGLIYMLRKAGYTVRPVTITNRDSEQKEQLEKMKAPVVFKPYVSDDGWIKAELPGKLYNFSNLTMLQQLQYADLANGAYYLVSRIRTNALSLGQNEQDVMKKVDSLLYENIPGKIISRQQIKNSGYPGFDIRNRTRRGDLQRYNIFVTPFEIFIFKISGNGDYAAGEEGDRFFASIHLKQLPAPQWSVYNPAEGSFSVKLPHAPVHSNNVALRSMSKRQEYEALDKKNGNSFLIIRKTIPDYSLLEEDTVELSFAEESFQQSQFIKQQKSRRIFNWLGRPCLEIVNQNTDNSFTQTRFLLQGANYYVLSARYQHDKKSAQDFFDTFTLRNPQYATFRTHKDTSLYFSVQTPVKADERDATEDMMEQMGGDEDEYYRSMYNLKEQQFQSDSTGETVHVTFQKLHRYFSVKDSAGYWNDKANQYSNDGDLVVYSKKYEKLPGWESCLFEMRDTNSTKNFLYKIYLRKGAVYTLSAITDNIAGPSEFVTKFFDSFTPEDTMAGTSIYRNKTPLLLEDFYSKDSVFRKQARQSIVNVNYRDEDVPALIRMIKGWHAGEKNYSEVKIDLIEQLGTIQHPDILPFLRQAYQAANDTSALQYAVLSALLHQQTREAQDVFRELVLKEIPVFGDVSQLTGLFEPLYDSLQLSAALFPDLLQFTALTDYKNNVYTLLAELADSGYIRPEVYKDQINQIAFDARVNLQKQLSNEQRMNEKDDDEEETWSVINANMENYPLHNFAILLLPYKHTNKNAERFFSRYETLKNTGQQVLRAQLYLRNKLPVTDSLLNSIAGKEKYRVKLWEALEEIDTQNRFPAKYGSQESIARSVLYNEETYDKKIDTLVLLGKQQTMHRFRKGNVYVYKYRAKNSDRWRLAVSGMQPENGKQCSADDALTQLTDLPFEADKPLPGQFAKVVRHVKYRNRYGWESSNQAFNID